MCPCVSPGLHQMLYPIPLCVSRPAPDAAQRQRAAAAVRDSCLPPFLARELAQGSFKDMASRAAYYGTLVWLVYQLCTPELAPLIVAVPAPGPQVSAAAQGTVRAG